jgi:hypothetical protein
MTASVALLISLEMLGRSASASGTLAIIWNAAIITTTRIKVIIHMTIEVSRTMKPGANTNEPAAMKPFRAVVAIGRASIGCGVIVTVRTSWLDSNSNAKADLRMCLWRTCRDEECGGCGERKKHILIHDLSS